MPDITIQPMPPRYAPPPSNFWVDVWKIALGIFLGSVISFLFCGLIALLAAAVLESRNAPKSQQAQRAAVPPVDEISPMVAEYRVLARSKATERDKAAMAESIAAAYRERGNIKAANQWEETVQQHEAAAVVGK